MSVTTNRTAGRDAAPPTVLDTDATCNKFVSTTLFAVELVFRLLISVVNEAELVVGTEVVFPGTVNWIKSLGAFGSGQKITNSCTSGGPGGIGRRAAGLPNDERVRIGPLAIGVLRHPNARINRFSISLMHGGFDPSEATTRACCVAVP